MGVFHSVVCTFQVIGIKCESTFIFKLDSAERKHERVFQFTELINTVCYWNVKLEKKAIIILLRISSSFLFFYFVNWES